MARTTSHPPASKQVGLENRRRKCAACGGPARADYRARRSVVTLEAVVALKVQVRVCHREGCALYRKAVRAEEEGRWVLPEHEFGLDVIALIGALRYQEHRSVPEIHAALCGRGVPICERSVTNLLDRYDELLTLRLTANQRLRELTRQQDRVVLAIDGLQPDVGHEVLWVVRECLSGQVLLARSLLASGEDDLVPLLEEVRKGLDVPVAGVVSDGQRSIRNAVATALPGVPHQLCHFHYLREAARPLYEADRHAKKELKKQVRGVRPLERAVESAPADSLPSPPPASRTQLRRADSVRSRSLATWGRLLLPSRASRTASALNSGVKLRLFLRSMDTTSRVADL